MLVPGAYAHHARQAGEADSVTRPPLHGPARRPKFFHNMMESVARLARVSVRLPSYRHGVTSGAELTRPVIQSSVPDRPKRIAE